MTPGTPDLDALRAQRWWLTRRPVRSIERAGAFIEDVGFCLLFHSEGIALPSLWGAATDRSVHDARVEWGPDAERVWTWKDELPLGGLAWYGRFVRGRPSFLTPSLLADLYPRSGRPNDFDEQPLSEDARRIARVILTGGPMPSTELRMAAGMDGKAGSARFSRVLTELGRGLVVTGYGVEDVGGGWPSAVLELTARAFRVRPRRPAAARRLSSALRFLDTTLAARPYELGNAFGWGAAAARAALEELVDRGLALRDEKTYRPA